MNTNNLKLTTIKLPLNMKIEHKVKTLGMIIKELTKNINMEQFFMSTELIYLITNFVENDLNSSKYKSVNKSDVVIKIIEFLYEMQLSDEQKKKINQDIASLYDKNMIKKVTNFELYYLQFKSFFF